SLYVETTMSSLRRILLAAVAATLGLLATGCSTNSPKQTSIPWSRPAGWEFVWVYHLRHDGPAMIDEREIQFAEWVEPSEVTRRIARAPADFCPSFKLIWSLAVARMGEVTTP
ncbi:MAG: hypothetical protein ACKOTF_05200, partial [Opitutaceae bacterium]